MSSGHAGGGAHMPGGGAAGAAARPEIPACSAGAEDRCAPLCQGGQEEEGSTFQRDLNQRGAGQQVAVLRPIPDLAGQAIIKSKERS